MLPTALSSSSGHRRLLPFADVTSRLLLALCTMLLGVLSWGYAPASAHATAGRAPQVLFIGTSGLTWSDVTPQGTPKLWELAQRASLATLVSQTINARTCPADGWLTLGAGSRMAAARSATNPGGQLGCAPLPRVAAGQQRRQWQFPDWSALRSAADTQGRQAQLGSLRAALGQACVAADGPGARLAAADANGQVLGGASCALRLVDVGGITATDSPQRLGSLVSGLDSSRQVGPKLRAKQLRAVDDAVGRAVTTATPSTTIILGSLAEDSGRPALQVALMAGLGVEPGFLHSASTRQTGLVHTTDLTSTIIRAFGRPQPPEVTGSALTAKPDARPLDQRVGSLTTLQRQVGVIDAVVTPAMTGLGLLVLALLAATWWLLRRRNPHGRRGLLVLRWAALVAASAPFAFYLVAGIDWVRFAGDSPLTGVASGRALLAMFVPTLVVALLAGSVAAGGPWRDQAWGPVTVVAGLTALLIGVDVVRGASLGLRSVVGLHPLDGGRFFGMGNVPFALFATGALWALAGLGRAVAPRSARFAAAVIVIGGIAALVVDASPTWGADAGGPLALLPALALLAVLAAGGRLSWWRVLTPGLAAILLVAVAAIIDWRRPTGQRTHLGRFVQQLLDGTAGAMVQRKLAANFDLLTGGLVLAWLVPLGLLAMALILLHPRFREWLAPICSSDPAVRPTLIATLALLAVGLVVNDSGVGIPAAAAMLLLPMLVVFATYPPSRR